MERNLTCEAVILANKRWGDLHRLVTLLSPTLGLFEAVVYGAQKGKLAGGIEPFSMGTFYVYNNRPKKGYTLKDVDPIIMHGGIKGELANFYTASALSEIAMRMHGGDFSELYTLLRSCLLVLDSATIDPRRLLILYIWRCVRIMGLEPDLTSCPMCARLYGEKEILSFNAALNSLCCKQCADVNTEDYAWALGPGARRYLEFTQELPEAEAVLVPLSEIATMRLVRYMVRYMTAILGWPLRSLEGGVLLETWI
ncbi:MAG: DNA repair protein RecO [Sphaerochaetaceae bacterium]|jgi:DNA repair protein RecO (recombination protein O)|nr:DNA repair protein RecO [Sphaerochaetaceae bacterium]MDD3366332.1 DNA repair protein RecO [Sphaerochaetaceae bacterium]MDD4218718.1 DNA repair protein RecO [Sphaerochaetaceae bacterium]MDY0371144.1 DNA repair protein RecO [Sphaerochaetaceae bacterium]